MWATLANQPNPKRGTLKFWSIAGRSEARGQSGFVMIDIWSGRQSYRTEPLICWFWYYLQRQNWVELGDSQLTSNNFSSQWRKHPQAGIDDQNCRRKRKEKEIWLVLDHQLPSSQGFSACFRFSPGQKGKKKTIPPFPSPEPRGLIHIPSSCGLTLSTVLSFLIM